VTAVLDQIDCPASQIVNFQMLGRSLALQRKHGFELEREAPSEHLPV